MAAATAKTAALTAQAQAEQQAAEQAQVEQDNLLFKCAICHISADDSSNITQSSLFTNAAINCGHQFCSSCVERELSRRKMFPCPYCETPVKRVTLSTRTLDDVQCEKDTSWRRRIMKVYNKVQTDFPSLLEYNNYLEEVEDIIFSIVNEEPDAEECKAKIKQYEEENKSAIVIRQSQRADEERCIADKIAAELREAEKRKRDFVEVEKEVENVKRRMRLEQQQVLLGEREEVSAELRAAQMQGYRNEVRRQQKGRKAASVPTEGPRVREPKDGLAKETNITRELYEKRQSAGAGVPSGSIAVHEREFDEAVASLFYLT